MATLLRSLRGKELEERFAHRAGIEPFSYFWFEREKPVVIPTYKQLAKILKAHGFEPDTPPWVHIFDIAAVSRGMIPRDITEHPDGAVALIRTFRSIRRGDEKVTEEARAALMEKEPPLLDPEDEFDSLILAALAITRMEQDEARRAGFKVQ